MSHDRRFVGNTATRILGFDRGGRLISMPVSHRGAAWDEWIAESERRTAEGQPSKPAPAAQSNREIYLRSKKEAADARRAAARLERLKKEQAELEEELDRLNAELYGPAAADYVRAGEITARISQVEDRLMEIYGETDA